MKRKRKKWIVFVTLMLFLFFIIAIIKEDSIVRRGTNDLIGIKNTSNIGQIEQNTVISQTFETADTFQGVAVLMGTFGKTQIGKIHVCIVNEETEEIETIVDFIVHHKNTGNVQVTCSVSNEDAGKIKIPSVEMINYDVQDEKGRAVLAEDEIFDLSGEFSEWPLVYGTVDDIDSFGIKLTNGMFYSFDQRFDTTAYKVEGKKIVKGDMKKIIPGKRVQLYNAEQSCTFLFYEE